MVESGERASRSARSAIERLQAGNARFLDAIAGAPDPSEVVARLATADPYAIVLGCSDSRVPPEIIFGKSLGRLFVVRVAGNVAGNQETGTIEYALARWGCPLVVVLGHSQCGGIAAAMDRLPPGAEPPPDLEGASNLISLVSTIRSSLGWSDSSSADPWLDAVRINVQHTIGQLLIWSMPIRRRVEQSQLRIVGAIYHVETGAVEFLDQMG